MKTKIRHLGAIKQSAGFSYPALLIVIAVAAIFAQQATVDRQLQARREIENRIIAQGEEFVWALESYWLDGLEEPELPRNIDQLLDDRRFGSNRHLRNELKNPFPEGEWNVVFNLENRIVGIRLNSKRVPVKKAIRLPDGRTKKIKTYAEWVFEFVPKENSNR